MNDKNKKIGLFSLIMMIFSSIFGFANMPVAFLQMGYASIIWYIFAAIFFFLPVSMMLAEYGSTFKDEQGGIYAWLSNTIGEKLAFIGTFIWLSSWIVWLINISSKVFIPFSALLFGKDMTQTWAFGPCSATGLRSLAIIVETLLLFMNMCCRDEKNQYNHRHRLPSFHFILKGMTYFEKYVGICSNRC